jgi:urease accessory protein UreE
MLFDHRSKFGRKGDDTPARLRLCVSEDYRSILQLDRLVFDRDGAMEDVNPISAKTRQLSKTERAVGAQEDHESIAICHALGNRSYLIRHRYGSL